MSVEPARRRHLTIGAAILIPVAAIAAAVLIPRDDTHQVDLDEVVGRFRASTVPSTSDTVPATGAATTTTAAERDDDTSTLAPTTAVAQPAAPALVEPGVYVYRTVGFEHIDALSGVTHDYPAETQITVTADGCGVLLRWDALEERREEWRLCSTPAGIELQPRALQYHEFFGQQTPEDVVCDVPVLLVPVSAMPSEPVAQTCTLDTDPWLPTWEVLEAGALTIDGVTLDVRHVRMEIDDHDHFFEQYVADWQLAPSGLPVELVIEKHSRSPSAVGDVVYDEEIHLELISVDPLR